MDNTHFYFFFELEIEKKRVNRPKLKKSKVNFVLEIFNSQLYLVESEVKLN